MAEKEYIEREAAKKKHCEICMEVCICYRSKSTCDELKAFDLIPAADVRPVVKAEFVRCGDGKGVPYMCSHCGRTTPANMVEIWGVNYCPNCGADMRKEK